MASINELYSINPHPKQVTHSDLLKNAENKGKKTGTLPPASERKGKDTVEISHVAIKLQEINKESEHYVDAVKEAPTLSTEKIDKLKQQINDHSYLTESVIDQTIEKLINLDNYI